MSENIHHEISLEETVKKYHGTLPLYLLGFSASLVLTVLSFYLVWTHRLPEHTLIYTIVGLAFTQAAVQLRFFMHLGKESKPRWESISFFFMLISLIIIILGSIWIMYDLNQRVMDGMQM